MASSGTRGEDRESTRTIAGTGAAAAIAAASFSAWRGARHEDRDAGRRSRAGERAQIVGRMRGDRTGILLAAARDRREPVGRELRARQPRDAVVGADDRQRERAGGILRGVAIPEIRDRQLQAVAGYGRGRQRQCDRREQLRIGRRVLGDRARDAIEDEVRRDQYWRSRSPSAR